MRKASFSKALLVRFFADVSGGTLKQPPMKSKKAAVKPYGLVQLRLVHGVLHKVLVLKDRLKI